MQALFLLLSLSRSRLPDHVLPNPDPQPRLTFLGDPRQQATSVNRPASAIRLPIGTTPFLVVLSDVHTLPGGQCLIVHKRERISHTMHARLPNLQGRHPFANRTWQQPDGRGGSTYVWLSVLPPYPYKESALPNEAFGESVHSQPLQKPVIYGGSTVSASSSSELPGCHLPIFAQWCGCHPSYWRTTCRHSCSVPGYPACRRHRPCQSSTTAAWRCLPL
jgi:hypothetical protein